MKENFVFDYGVFRKRSMREEDPDRFRWVNETPQCRLDALEFLRKPLVEAAYATGGFQRVYRFVRREEGCKGRRF